MQRLVAALVLLAACATPSVEPEPDFVPGRGAWEPIAEAPIAGRSGHVGVWSGTEMLVWGGYGSVPDADGRLDLRDGAAYDPVARTWRRITDAPIAPSYFQTATWTGREMIVWGDRGGSEQPVGTAAYDPAADRWRELPPAPLGRLESTGSAWTGSELLVWGSRALDEPVGRIEVAAYDPESDRWRALPSPPLPGPRFAYGAQWTGERLVLFGGEEAVFYEGPGCPGPVCNEARVTYRPEAAALDPVTGAWERLPDRPESVRGGAAVGWTGQEVLVVASAQVGGGTDGGPGVLAYHPVSGSTRRVLDLPAGSWSHGTWTWTGEQLYRLEPGSEQRPRERAGGQVVDPRTGERSRLPTVELAATREQTVLWAGDRLLVWGGSNLSEFLDTTAPDDVRHSATGAAFRPDVAAEPAPEAAFEVRLEATADTGAPFSVEATDPGPLGLPGYAPSTLTVRAQRPLLWGFLSYDAWMESDDGGVLLSLAAGCGPPDPRSRIQNPDSDATCQIEPLELDPARPTLLELTATALEPPFAPTPGTYRVTVDVGWWEQVAPPTPYATIPDGRSTVTLTYTVEGRTQEGRDPRTEQPAARASIAAIPPCLDLLVPLATGDPETNDGAVATETGGSGWFGNGAFDSRTVQWNPPGPLPASPRVGVSHLVLAGESLLACPGAQNPAENGRTPTSLTTTGRAGDVISTVVTQQLGGGPQRPELVQRYELTNTGDAAVRQPLLRYVEDERFGEGRSLLAGASAGGRLLLSVGVGGDADSVALLVSGELDGRTAPDRWAVSTGNLLVPGGGPPAVTLAELERSGVIPDQAAGRVQGDADGDGLADVTSERPFLVQQWDLDLDPGETAVFTARTVLTTGDPAQLVSGG